jgi:Winged helix-turn helix
MSAFVMPMKCIQAVVDGDLKPIRAANRLGLTTRQVRRLARRYAAAGPAGLISKRFNRPSNNRTDDALADAVIKILRSTHADFGPTLASEKLRTQHGIDLVKETVRQLQDRYGPVDPAKAPATQNPATSTAACMPRRTSPNRWLRASMVRRSRAGVHGAGVCRRCDQSLDANSIHGNRVDVWIFRSDSTVFSSSRQAASVLQRQGQHLSCQSCFSHWRRWAHAVWSSIVRTQHRRDLREHPQPPRDESSVLI